MDILLVDNTPLYRNILQQSLGAYGNFQLHFAASQSEALALCERQRFCFYIVAWQLPDGDGTALTRVLRERGLAHLEPIVLLTASPSAELSERAAQAGATELFRKHDIDELVTFMRRFLAVFDPIHCRLLYVEDARDQRLALAAEMVSWGITVDAFASGEEAWLALQDTAYDLVVCDVVLEGRMSGSRLINRIRRLPGVKGDIPILAATAFDNPARRIELFHLGIDDYIAKPIVSLELQARIQNILARKRAVDRSQLLLKATALGVLVVNAEGLIRSADGNAQVLFGKGEAELVGRGLQSLVSMAELPAAGATVPLMACLVHPAQIEKFRTTACRGGEAFPAEMSVLEIDGAGEGRAYAVLVRDLTEEHELERRLLAAKEAAERGARMKSEFLANMSHEIRTPLNGVLGMAQVGLRLADDRERTADVLRKIISSGKLLQGIIDDILDFSKIEAGKMPIESTPLDLQETLELAVDLVREQAASKGLALRVERGPALPGGCLGDPLRLRQVLVNLLSNAVKFTAQGSVTLTAERDGDCLTFAVTDTGIGIAADQIARLFNAFEQADGSMTRRFGGTGLGLAITQRLVALMAGAITVDSQLGRGSTFRVRLPYRPLGLEDVATEATPATTAGCLAGLSILVAEDNDVNQMVIKANLEHEGARVTIARDGAEAVEQVRRAAEGSFDVVLMDIMMPNMDGYEATRHIRALAPGLPIIGQTAHAMQEERERCRAAGMVDHLAKPINPQELVATILRYVSPSRA